MIGHNWPDAAIRIACQPYCRDGFSDPDLDPMIDDGRRKWDTPESPPPHPGEPPTAEVDPVDLWPDAHPPLLPSGLLPKRIETFARAGAKLVGADVVGFAMAALAASAAAIPDSILLRPMRYSLYAESARIWVALVGDPSARKTADPPTRPQMC